MTWVESLLASGVVKGIGPKTAKRITDQLGANAMHMLCNDPSGVANTCRITNAQAEAIRDALTSRADNHKVLELLMGNGVSKFIADKVIQHYGKRASAILKKDPYQLAREVSGIGFITADKIAEKLGFSSTCPQRVRGCIFYVLEESLNNGHCYMVEKQLVAEVRIMADVPFASILDEIAYLKKSEEIVAYGPDIYTYRAFRAITDISKFIASRTPEKLEPISDHVEKSIENTKLQTGFVLTDQQRDAVGRASAWGLSIVTGGPGCGKTTVVRTIANLFQLEGKRLALAAPTGRAAQRMGELCGVAEASTIHRLLRFDPHTNRFAFNASCQLPYDAIIIDESSMLDIFLAKALFAAIPKSATLVLVGDKDQLPSVGPGRVFADMVTGESIPTTVLTNVFRQREGSEISQLAQGINRGEWITQMPNQYEYKFIQKADTASALRAICDLVTRENVRDTIVITASNGGAVGVDALNAALQAKVNPTGDCIVYKETTFRVGDRVCHRKNNYHIHRLGVFNGDMGEVMEVNRAANSLKVRLWDNRVIEYSSKWLHQLSLAYAVTVHRAQGSEMTRVIFAVHDYQYTLLNRQLIYTAVTRAKSELIVVGSAKAMNIGVKRLMDRNSGLFKACQC